MDGHTPDLFVANIRDVLFSYLETSKKPAINVLAFGVCWDAEHLNRIIGILDAPQLAERCQLVYGVVCHCKASCDFFANEPRDIRVSSFAIIEAQEFHFRGRNSETEVEYTVFHGASEFE